MTYVYGTQYIGEKTEIPIDSPAQPGKLYEYVLFVSEEIPPDKEKSVAEFAAQQLKSQIPQAEIKSIIVEGAKKKITVQYTTTALGLLSPIVVIIALILVAIIAWIIAKPIEKVAEALYEFFKIIEPIPPAVPAIFILAVSAAITVGALVLYKEFISGKPLALPKFGGPEVELGVPYV